jgi:hypothetical protein
MALEAVISTRKTSRNSPRLKWIFFSAPQSIASQKFRWWMAGHRKSFNMAKIASCIQEVLHMSLRLY